MAGSESGLYQIPGQHVYEGVAYHPVIIPEAFQRLTTFELGKGDVLLATFPKSGTMWMYVLSELVQNEGQESEESLSVRMLGKRLEEALSQNYDTMIQTAPPRFFRTHLQYRYLKPQVNQGQVKVIVVMRNIKDVLVSFYHYYCICDRLGYYPGTWNEFFELFKNGGVLSGDWVDYNLRWWEQRDRDNVLIVKYEDMKCDLKTTVKQVASFLGKQLGEEVVDKIVRLCSFTEMKKNPMVNLEDMPMLNCKDSSFYRKGEVGDWKNYFNKEQNEYVDQLLEEKLPGTGLNFSYD